MFLWVYVVIGFCELGVGFFGLVFYVDELCVLDGWLFWDCVGLVFYCREIVEVLVVYWMELDLVLVGDVGDWVGIVG